MDSLLTASATEIAEMIRSKKISSVEATTANLERIKMVNPALNAVVQLCEERALSEAAERDAEIARGENRGALHGVPFTLKDSHDTEGIISTGGTTGRTEYIPDLDSPPTARMRAAGGVLMGKTNTPELTFGSITENLIYGRTNNPYDLNRTPGGSSGGAAAIVAAGGSPVDLGSDTGGSIRGPANFCGVAGLKPTSGRVPRTGHIVSPGGPRDSFTTIGPLARRVDDLWLTFPLIAGSDWRDPYIVDMPIGDPGSVSVAGLRIAVYDDNGVMSPAPEVAEAVRIAASALSDAGASVTNALPGPVTAATKTADDSREAYGEAYTRALLAHYGTTRIGPILQSRLADANDGALSVEGIANFQAEIDRHRIEMLSFMEDFDAIVCPVAARPAPLHDYQVNTNRGGYTHIYNMTGWPVAVVRANTSPEGLPVGVQIVARPWREDV
ncbi:MAG: amidase, partial [Chloroflexi bacterium]|nr:amidase [Chloroflexota bacterium]